VFECRHAIKNVNAKTELEDLRQNGKKSLCVWRETIVNIVIIQNDINKITYFVLKTRTLLKVSCASRVMVTCCLFIMV